MKIYPDGFEAEAESSPLSISAARRTTMVNKAKELLVEPMEEEDLMSLLEQYYITEENKHYTSAQLKEIIDQVKSDLAPAVEEEVIEP